MPTSGYKAEEAEVEVSEAGRFLTKGNAVSERWNEATVWWEISAFEIPWCPSSPLQVPPHKRFSSFTSHCLRVIISTSGRGSAQAIISTMLKVL